MSQPPTHGSVSRSILPDAARDEGHILEALRISPRDTRAGTWTAIVGHAKFYAGRDEEVGRLAEPCD